MYSLFTFLPPDLVKEKVSFVCFSVFNPFPTLTKLLLRKGTQASGLEHFIGSIGTEYVYTFLFLLHFEIIIYLWQMVLSFHLWTWENISF